MKCVYIGARSLHSLSSCMCMGLFECIDDIITASLVLMFVLIIFEKDNLDIYFVLNSMCWLKLNLYTFD